MRTIFVMALVLACAFMAGWFTIHRNDGETTIKINRDEIRNDAKTAINKGRDYLDTGPGGQQGHYHGDQFFPDGGSHAQQQQPYGEQPYGQQPYGQPAGQQQYTVQSGQTQTYQSPLQQAPNQQQGNGGFYYPNDQHANRPPAPWETQPPYTPPATQQQRQF